MNLGYKDTFRELHPGVRLYSWFNNKRPLARSENKGWRIDYIMVSDNLMSRV